MTGEPVRTRTSGTLSRVFHNTDILSALIFGGVGAGFVAASLDLRFGEPMDMGPAFFPRAVGILLILVALLIAANGIRELDRSDVDAPRLSFDIVPIFKVAVATIGFALTLQWLGLVASSALLVVIAGHSIRGARWREVIPLALFLSIGAGILFVYGLGLQAPLYPRF